MMAVLVLAAAAILFALSLSGYKRNPTREIELASHFALQYAVAAAGLFFIAAFFNANIWAYIFLTGTLLATLSQLLPFIFFSAEDPQPMEVRPLKILQANVLKLNTDPEPLRRLIETERPDVIALAEVTPVFAIMLAGMRGAYPYGAVEPEEKSSYGMALLSRQPLAGFDSFAPDGGGSRAMAAQLTHDGHVIDVISIHPATPNRDMASRDREFDAIARRIGARSRDLVLMGDFNATPYCQAYKKLVGALKLRNAREGFGLCGSFPVFLPTPLLKLPIDHVLVGSNLKVLSCRTGAPTGSDHLPLIATLCVAKD
ncbi:MAG: endonuclease/exonuclease/phosphatase family protein [Micavibrio sp.]|nr:endonuclease/exonuclease/phosphatase family protein [Micavibrio sp.]